MFIFFYLTYAFLYFSFSLFTITMLATLISLVRNGKERVFLKVDGESHVEIKEGIEGLWGRICLTFSFLAVS
jgi:hypothetical protein